MRMLVKFRCPIEPFNSLLRRGEAGKVIAEILQELQPEAVYFTAGDGHRGGIMVADLEDTSEIPKYAEPLFLKFNATVEFVPYMSPDDLMNSGLDEIGKKWG